MPAFFPEGNVPRGGDTEVRSLQKITSLGLLWAQSLGVTPSIPWLGGSAPSPHDNECLSLQKFNAQLFAIANV